MKLLFVTSTRVGDAILSTGLIDHLITKYPEARITIVCGPAAASLFEAVPNLDRIIVLDKMLFSLHWLRLWVLCVGHFWHLVVDLRNAPVAFLLARRRRRGMPRGGADRRVERIAEVLDLPEIVPPKLWASQEDKDMAAELIPEGGPVLAVGPTANWRAKTWRGGNFFGL